MERKLTESNSLSSTYSDFTPLSRYMETQSGRRGGVGWGGVLYKPNLLYQIMKTWHFHYFRSRPQGSMPYSSATSSQLAPFVRKHSSGPSKCSNRLVNVSQPGGHYMYRQFNIQQFYVLPTQCISVFCVDLRTNSHYFPTQH